MFYVHHVLGGDSTGIHICGRLLSCILKMSTLTVSKLYLNGKISSKILLSLMFMFIFIIPPPPTLYLSQVFRQVSMVEWAEWGRWERITWKEGTRWEEGPACAKQV